jgi:hypothetical protein
MLRAFFDESGTDATDPVLVMGGFLGPVEEWERATERWDEVCLQHPRIECFSRKEATSLGKQFRSFSREAAAAKTNALAEVISQFDLQGFCVSVSHGFFAHRDAKISKGMFGSRIYDWAFLFAVLGTLEHVCEHIEGTDQVDFIFDHRNELDECIPFVNKLKRSESLPCNRRFGTCTPGDDKALVPLQMADLLAGEFYQSFVTHSAGVPLALATGRRGFIHIPCRVPNFIPEIQHLHGVGKKITDRVKLAKKKYYRDGERSSELLGEIDFLLMFWKLFEAQLEKVTSGAGMEELWKEYEAKIGRSSEEIKGDE